MIKLYGFPMSNYFNMVKAALLEKGVPFEYVPTRPSQEADYLAKSPAGKVPCIETEEGWLSETQTLLEYIEECHPEPALLPRDHFARAKVRELMHALELYIELPARNCYPATFFGSEIGEGAKAYAKEQLTKGARSIRQLARFNPYIAGPELTLADLIGLYSLPIADRVTKKLWDWDLLADLPGASEWMKTMNARPAMQTIRNDQRAAASSAG